MDDKYYQIDCNYYETILRKVLPIISFPKDVTLICEKKKLKAHKFMLAVYSKHFDYVFTESPELNIYHFHPGVNFEDLEVTLDYIYTGKLVFRHSRLIPLMKLLDNLQVRGIIDTNENLFDCEAVVATSNQSRGHVQDRENPYSSANGGLTCQPPENDDDDEHSSTAVVDQVSKDYEYQEFLPPAAAVDQNIHDGPGVNHHDLSLAPASVDQGHDISYSSPELKMEQQWKIQRPCQEQVEGNSQTLISLCPSKAHITYSETVDNSIPKKIETKCSKDSDIDFDSPDSKTSPAFQTLKPQWQMTDPVKKKMIPVKDAIEPQPCSSSFKAAAAEKKCLFCEDQHEKLSKMRFTTRQKFLDEICKDDAAMCEVLAKTVNIYYHSPCMTAYQNSHLKRKSKIEEEANKKKRGSNDSRNVVHSEAMF